MLRVDTKERDVICSPHMFRKACVCGTIYTAAELNTFFLSLAHESAKTMLPFLVDHDIF